MIIIAYSGTLNTYWAIVEDGNVIAQASTSGINPYFMSRREISHVIRIELPEKFFQHRWEHVYFYGAGCENAEKNKIVESSLVAQFKSPVTVMYNLLGAARSLLQKSPGLAAIICNGSNSCLYDGEKIVKNTMPGGYLLGDEASNSYLGKCLLSDILKGITPDDLRGKFLEKYDVTPSEIMDRIYSAKHPATLMYEYSYFLAENIEHPYVHDLVYNAFVEFFKRNIMAYDYHTYPLACVGRTCTLYSTILRQAAADLNINVSLIEQSPMPGLIKYHS